MSSKTKTHEAAMRQKALQKNSPKKRRGRPESDPKEAAVRTLRRIHFGEEMRAMREFRGLRLTDAAKLAGLSSPRQLAQYETTCYPPGSAIAQIAETYGITVSEMAALKLSHEDPITYEALTGQPGYIPEPESVEAYLNTLNTLN